MNQFTAAAALSAALCLSSIPFALADDGILPDCPIGQSFTQGDITITGAFARATLKGAPTAGGYLTISNKGGVADTLASVTSAAASDVSIHSMKMNGQVMEMAPVEGGLEVPPGGSVSLDPAGYHLMLMGMSGPLVQGQCVTMVLHFARAGDLPVELNIGGIAQKEPPGAPAGGASIMPSGGMDMGSMQRGG